MLPQLPLHFWHALGTGLFVISAAAVGMVILAYIWYWIIRFLGFVVDVIAAKTRLSRTNTGLILFAAALLLPIAYAVGLEIVH